MSVTKSVVFTNAADKDLKDTWISVVGKEIEARLPRYVELIKSAGAIRKQKGFAFANQHVNYLSIKEDDWKYRVVLGDDSLDNHVGCETFVKKSVCTTVANATALRLAQAAVKLIMDWAVDTDTLPVRIHLDPTWVKEYMGDIEKTKAYIREELPGVDFEFVDYVLPHNRRFNSADLQYSRTISIEPDPYGIIKILDYCEITSYTAKNFDEVVSILTTILKATPLNQPIPSTIFPSYQKLTGRCFDEDFVSVLHVCLVNSEAFLGPIPEKDGMEATKEVSDFFRRLAGFEPGRKFVINADDKDYYLYIGRDTCEPISTKVWDKTFECSSIIITKKYHEPEYDETVVCAFYLYYDHKLKKDMVLDVDRENLSIVAHDLRQRRYEIVSPYPSIFSNTVRFYLDRAMSITD